MSVITTPRAVLNRDSVTPPRSMIDSVWRMGFPENLLWKLVISPPKGGEGVSVIHFTGITGHRAVRMRV